MTTDFTSQEVAMSEYFFCLYESGQCVEQFAKHRRFY